MDGETASAPDSKAAPNAHRRRASSLYGLIIAGSILATSGAEERLLAVAVALVATLGVYWSAETYVHLMAERSVERHVLSRRTARGIALDGLPLVTISLVPIVALLVGSLAGLPTARAVEIALYVNTGVLLIEGYRISRGAELRGWRLTVTVAFTGLLGVIMIALKAGLSH